MASRVVYWNAPDLGDRVSHRFPRSVGQVFATGKPDLRPAWTSYISILSQIEAKCEPIEYSSALEKAQGELADVANHAAEEDYPIPTEKQIERAGTLLRRMFDMAPGDYTVYPTPDARIGIDITEDGVKVAVFIRADGSAECYVDRDDSQSHAWYRNWDEASGAFLQDALAKPVPSTASCLRSWHEFRHRSAR